MLFKYNMSLIIKVSPVCKIRTAHHIIGIVATNATSRPLTLSASSSGCLLIKSTPITCCVRNVRRCIASEYTPLSLLSYDRTLTVSYAHGSLHYRHYHHVRHRLISLITSRPLLYHRQKRDIRFMSWDESCLICLRSLSNHSHKFDKTSSDVDNDSMCGNVNIHKDIDIVFMNGNIVAVNKPYGLSVYGGTEKSDSNKKTSNNMTLTKMLPTLSAKLKCSKLDVGLSLKSFYSGIVLLSKNQGSTKSLIKAISTSQAQKKQFITYLAITVGVPQCSYEESLTANIRRERLHSREMSTVSDTYSHNACKEGTMIQVFFDIKPLVVNRSAGVALVQITLNKDKWEAVEVLMSHYLSPVLGDHIYSSRTLMVSGIPFPASAQASLPGKQKLPSTILELLHSNTDLTDQVNSDKGVTDQVNSEDKDLANQVMPLFAHRHKVTLNQFPNQSSPPLIISAPPQKKFLTMLQCLGLYQEGMFS